MKHEISEAWRWIVGSLMGLVVTLASWVGRRLHDRIARVEVRVDAHETALARHTEWREGITGALGRIEAKIDKHGAQTSESIRGVHERIDRLMSDLVRPE